MRRRRRRMMMMSRRWRRRGGKVQWRTAWWWRRSWQSNSPQSLLPLVSFTFTCSSCFKVLFFSLKQDYLDSFSSFQLFSILFSSFFSCQKWQFWCLVIKMLCCCARKVVIWEFSFFLLPRKTEWVLVYSPKPLCLRSAACCTHYSM